MIRNWLAIVLILVAVTGCASWKKPKENQTLKPGTFSVSSVSVRAGQNHKANLEFAELVRRAADRNRIAYNVAVGGDEASYRMVLSLDHISVDREVLSFLPVTSNKIAITATLIDEASGKIAKSMPVSHQLIAIDDEESRERQLIRGIMPKTFNDLHGLGGTPEDVKLVVQSRELFEPHFYARDDGPIIGNTGSEPQPQASRSPDSPSNSAASIEPKVISCAVC